MSGVFRWTPSHGRVIVGCTETECCLEDLLETMDDRDECQERGEIP